jgi:tRNA dimethylallyltransferase
MLSKLDPKRAKDIDKHNPVRLIRAIEVAKGKPPASLPRSGPATSPAKALAILWIGINPPRKTLRKNIRTRLIARMKAGMVTEARKLHKKGLPWARMEELGLEYRYLARLLQKKITKEEFVERLEREINGYAKRQMRWFKRNGEIHWVTNKAEAEKLAKRFLGGR